MEGHAALAGALQGRQAVARLFEADAEAVLQQFHVIAVVPGRLVEDVIGHQQRTREVVRKRDTRQPAGVVVGEVTFLDQQVDLALGSQQADLVRGLEIAAVGAQHLRQVQHALVGVEPAHGAGVVLEAGR